MNEVTTRRKIWRAIKALAEDQPDLFRLTAETHQTEWNLAHHLANEIQEVFPGYRCDLELVKPNEEKRRPDIVVHRRGTNEANILVVEVKLDGSKADVGRDAEKIRNHWFRAPLRYAFGAVVNLRTGGRDSVDVFKNE